MRPGVSHSAVEAVRRLFAAGDRIVEFDMRPVDVSSTDVRARVARGESLDGLVPPAVAEAVARLGLYRDAE
jgi:nicotinate-nucleotide adenylyltransferase